MKHNENSDSLTARSGRRLQMRRLNASDGLVLQQFNASLSARSRQLFLPHSYDDETVARLLERSEKGEDLLLGLFDGPTMVGYFFLWYFTERVPLLGIGLHDAFQGEGLGGQILEYLVRQAKSNGCEAIELTTLPNNNRAFALYRKTGFRYVGDVENINGSGERIIERAMFYEIIPGAHPFDREHCCPV